MFSKIYIIVYILFIYMCKKVFSTTLDKGLRKNNKNKGMEKLESINQMRQEH